MNEVLLELKNIEKSYEETKVIRGINLLIQKGQFVTILGSSGCGKTTTIRIIAGLENPDRGNVFLDGVDVTNIEPNKRDVNTVFQNYALFPHMNVETNIGYSLRLRKIHKKEIKQRVEEVLELVQLTGYEKRLPSELSGGQKQRVAIARAIINNPKLLLLDEPLGALDLQLRRQMQLELKRLQKRLNITFIYITHDQEEALNMSDQIVVMKEGTFEQIGTPEEIYNNPKTSYVAKFVGTANVLEGIVDDIYEDTAVISILNSKVNVSLKNHHLVVGQKATIAIRSENTELLQDNDRGLKGVITEKSFVGGLLRIVTTLSDGTEIVTSRHGMNSNLSIGDSISIDWQPENAVFVDLEE